MRAISGNPFAGAITYPPWCTRLTTTKTYQPAMLLRKNLPIDQQNLTNDTITGNPFAVAITCPPRCNRPRHPKQPPAPTMLLQRKKMSIGQRNLTNDGNTWKPPLLLQSPTLPVAPNLITKSNHPWRRCCCKDNLLLGNKT